MAQQRQRIIGIQPTQYISISSVSAKTIMGAVVEESLVCISVNGEELATFMCSPRDLEALALGFLYNEGLIQQMSEVHHIHVAKNDSCVDVWLHNTEQTLPQRKIITAGCGGGVTFDDLSQQHDPIQSTLQVTTTQIIDLMKQLHQGATLYQEARGIHTAVLATPDAILAQVEDVGRHNCVDKIAGMALQHNIPTQDKILLSSGRISSEMLNKARRLGIPVVCSRTSPTSLSVALAEAWQMTLVAYLRQNRMRIYTHPERILMEET